MSKDYSNKTGEVGHDKALSSKSMDMIKGGGSGDGSGPTGSSRSYPKGGKPSMSPDFNPMKDKKRGATDWVVGGV
jgi:hypothetical protein